MIANAHKDGTVVLDAPQLIVETINIYKNKLTCKESLEKDVLALEAKINQLQQDTKKSRKVQFDQKT